MDDTHFGIPEFERKIGVTRKDGGITSYIKSLTGNGKFILIVMASTVIAIILRSAGKQRDKAARANRYFFI